MQATTISEASMPFLLAAQYFLKLKEIQSEINQNSDAIDGKFVFRWHSVLIAR